MRTAKFSRQFARQLARAACAITVLSAMASAAHAVDIFSNPISSGGPVSGINPYTDGQYFDPNITVSGIGHGSGVVPNAATGGTRYNQQGWAASLDENDYFTFTLTPNPGYEIDFTSLAGTWQRSGSGPNQYQLKSSLDNFGANIIASGAISGSGSQVAIPTMDLSSIQNVTTPIEFRLYAFGNGAAGGTFSFNDFTFDGSVNAVSGAGDLDPATNSVNFSNRIVGNFASQSVSLNEVGGSNVNYTASTSGDATLPFGNSGFVGAGSSGSLEVGISTDFAGPKSGTVSIDDGNADSDDISVAGNVYDASLARFDSNDLTSITIDFGTVAQGSGTQSIGEAIANAVQTAGYTAELDLDSISFMGGDGSVLSTDLSAFSNLAAGSAQSFAALFDTNNAPNSYSATYQLALSDSNFYEGASSPGSQLLTLNLTGTISADAGLEGDYNGDQKVDALDYVVWRMSPDNHGGSPNGYQTWVQNYGEVSGSGSAAGTSAVPEPASLILLAMSLSATALIAPRRTVRNS